MKKIAFCLVIMAVMASCGDNKTKKAPSVDSSVNSNRATKMHASLNNGKTLNGIDEGVATTMIDNFTKDYDKDISDKPVDTWYSKKEITNIYNLLKYEYDHGLGTDGVRIYFGSDKKTDGSNKLNVSIFLVSTFLEYSSDPYQSDHRDYYDHTASFLDSTTGSVFHNINTEFAAGARLYGTDTPKNVNCNYPSRHYIQNKEAFNWVGRRCNGRGNNDNSGYNTIGEWFDLCFISGLFSAIMDDANNLDGLRIYLAKGTIDESGERDVFVLVPTKSDGHSHVDYYDCINIPRNARICAVQPDSVHSSKKKIPKKVHTAQSFMTFLTKQGFDKGELCPTNCN